ncbi:hypothetical protein RIF29_40703 [Crotalaria pallida]|uniref:Uncharacterized protein n=1 Tax=Crotalaria pallida TaxID=3830 RepID=A0AAN9HQX7_CROPI
MGNCCTLASSSSSSMEWAGEDWGSVTSKHNNKSSSSKVFEEVLHHHGLNNLGNVKKERLLGLARTSSDANNGKVKIMISKKELAELLGEKHYSIGISGGAQHASAEQVLVRLINAKLHLNDHHHDAHHRPWRPVLQSIPELN